MSNKIIMSDGEIKSALTRIAHEIVERNHGCDDLVFIGMLTRGVPIARRIAAKKRAPIVSWPLTFWGTFPKCVAAKGDRV